MSVHKENHRILDTILYSVRVNRSIKANLNSIALPSQEMTTYVSRSFVNFLLLVILHTFIANVFKKTFKLKIIMWCIKFFVTWIG